MTDKATPRPWLCCREGSAHTIFRSRNGADKPETVAEMLSEADAYLIVETVNARDALMSLIVAAKRLVLLWDCGHDTHDFPDDLSCANYEVRKALRGLCAFEEPSRG